MERPKRKYSERDKATVLAHYESTRNASQTAKAFGFPVQTVQSWVDGTKGVNQDIAERVVVEKGNLADAFERVAWEAVKLAPAAASEASFAQLMTGAGIATDKALLLRGQATVITHDLSKEEREAAAKDLLETVYLRVVEGRKSA